MTLPVYRFEFDEHVALEEIESTIVLALFAVESLHGESRTQLDAAHLLDQAAKVLVIEAHTPVGRDFARLMTGFLRREFTGNSFHVRRHFDPPEQLARAIA